MTQELIEQVFAPAFGMTDVLTDGALLPAMHGRPVTTTDTFVVNPLFFPGGDIGSLSIHGTVNDLAVMGARPLFVTAGFVLEEGFEIADLMRVVVSMAGAAREAGVRVVAGDTKVVERGHGDGVYINTTGIGLIEQEPPLEPGRLTSGDVLVVNGPLGDHGMAVMNARNSLGLESDIQSDSAALNGLIDRVRKAAPSVHAMRDLTRGGLSAALCEWASATGLGIEIDERTVPVRSAVATASEILGMDPMQIANEGKVLVAVPADETEAALAAMRADRMGKACSAIGVVTDRHPGIVVGQTAIGGERVIDMPIGELLPRIC